MNSQNITVAELSNRIGTCIPCFQGVIDLVWDRKSGEKNGKEWSLQPGLMEYGGAKVKVIWWNRGEMSGMKGKHVWLSARNSKGKWSGLDVVEKEWEGKKSIEISVAKFAGLTCDVDKFNATQQAGEGYQADEEARAPQVPSEPQKPVKSSPSVNSSPSGVLVARQRMMQLANMFGMARDAAKYIAKVHGFEGVQEDVRTCSTSLFIQAVREGLDKSMPAHPLVNGKPELAPDDIPFGEDPTAGDAF